MKERKQRIACIINVAQLTLFCLLRHFQKSNLLSTESLQQRAMFRLATKLIQAARNSRLDSAGLRSYLLGLRNQFERESIPAVEE